MNKDKIGQALRDWAKEMVRKYEWLTIKFEYSDARDRYLVSYSPSAVIEDNEAFCRESMSFEDEMNLMFPDDAPLFCDEERLFRLSGHAEVFQGTLVSIPLIITSCAVIWEGHVTYESENQESVVSSSSESFETIMPNQNRKAA
ncbi:MAG: hypothetical protein K6B45_04665 [Bacteroidaceae bacterium]|nr:hypothetical protein [Bacteroidaceae bacterium]